MPKTYHVDVKLTSTDESGNNFHAAWHVSLPTDLIEKMRKDARAMLGYDGDYAIVQHFGRLIQRAVERGDSLESSRKKHTD